MHVRSLNFKSYWVPILGGYISVTFSRVHPFLSISGVLHGCWAFLADVCPLLIIGFAKGGGWGCGRGSSTGHVWRKGGLCGNFATNSNHCGVLDLWCPNSRGKCGDFASSKARGNWEQVVFFAWLMKRLQGRMRRCVLKSIVYFVLHEIDHLSNISVNRTVGQLAENSGEKKKLLKEMRCLSIRSNVSRSKVGCV